MADYGITEVINGLNMVFDGLPLLIRSKQMSNKECHAIISGFKTFVAFMQILRDYVGGEHLGIIVLSRLY